MTGSNAKAGAGSDVLRVLVVGSTSAIAHATARCFAREGAALCVAARDPQRRAANARELAADGAALVEELAFEATALDRIGELFDTAVERLGELDALLIAHGELPDQLETERDVAALRRALDVNGTSVVVLLHHAARYFETRGSGCIAVIGSGAGVRGRRATYTYGMAKGLVALCLQGLRARLHPAGVKVVTVLPCFVDTPMTAYLPRALRFVSPRAAGARIHRAMLRGTDVVHVPRWWRLALFAARNAPEALVKRSRSEQRFVERLERDRRSDAFDEPR